MVTSVRGYGQRSHFSDLLRQSLLLEAPQGKPRGGGDWESRVQGPAMGPEWWGLRPMGTALDLWGLNADAKLWQSQSPSVL